MKHIEELINDLIKFNSYLQRMNIPFQNSAEMAQDINKSNKFLYDWAVQFNCDIKKLIFEEKTDVAIFHFEDRMDVLTTQLRSMQNNYFEKTDYLKNAQETSKSILEGINQTNLDINKTINDNQNDNQDKPQEDTQIKNTVLNVYEKICQENKPVIDNIVNIIQNGGDVHIDSSYLELVCSEIKLALLRLQDAKTNIPDDLETKFNIVNSYISNMQSSTKDCKINFGQTRENILKSHKDLINTQLLYANINTQNKSF